MTPWDVSCTATDAALARMLRALVLTGGHFTSSLSLGSVEKSSRAVEVFFRIWLPPGAEVGFSQIAGVPVEKVATIQLS